MALHESLYLQGRRSRNPATQQAQQQLLDAISTVKGRGVSGISPEQQAAVQEAVSVMEEDGGLRVSMACAAHELSCCN